MCLGRAPGCSLLLSDTGLPYVGFVFRLNSILLQNNGKMLNIGAGEMAQQSSRGPVFCSLHPRDCSQFPVAIVSGDLMPSSGLIQAKRPHTNKIKIRHYMQNWQLPRAERESPLRKEVFSQVPLNVIPLYIVGQNRILC